MAAGGPEWAKRRDREANGIPMPDGLYTELKAAAIAAGVHFEAQRGTGPHVRPTAAGPRNET